MKVFFYKIVVKCITAVLRILSHLKKSQIQMEDPTRILIDNLTPRQVEALSGRSDLGQDIVVGSHTGKLRLGIVVPFRDRWELTKACLESLLKQEVSQLSVHILLVDNGSQEQITASGLVSMQAKLERRGFTVQHVKDARPFNYSALNNSGVKELSRNHEVDVLMFLNNDVEIESMTAIAELARFVFCNDKAGAVGCTLLYPDRKIQHLFVAPGLRIVAGHPGRNLEYNENWAWFSEPRPVPAVTGAVLVVRFQDFIKVGGFNELLTLSCQDVDLCLKLLANGKINWVLPHIVMTHHEMATRKGKHKRSEVEQFYRSWTHLIEDAPLYSKKISRWSEYPSFSFGEGAFPWRWFLTEFEE